MSYFLRRLLALSIAVAFLGVALAAGGAAGPARNLLALAVAMGLVGVALATAGEVWAGRPPRAARRSGPRPKRRAQRR